MSSIASYPLDNPPFSEHASGFTHSTPISRVLEPGRQPDSSAVEIVQLDEAPYDCEYYDEYIRDDLHNSRIVLHAETFLELVCDITLACYQDKVRCILDDQVFRHRLTEFLAKCDTGAVLDESLDDDIASLYERGLELLDDIDPLPVHAAVPTLKFAIDSQDGVCHTDDSEEIPFPQLQDKTNVSRDDALFSPEAGITNQVQCARYAMAELSKILLHRHVILTLFDGDSFQMHYYDRSVIAVSSAVNLSSREGQELFVSMLMGLRRLGLGEWNVLDESQKLSLESGCHFLESCSRDRRELFHGMTLCVGAENYTLQEILFRQPDIIGRATCVVAAKDCHGNEVVLKITCSVEGQQSEVDLIEQARAYASRDDGHKWVLMHLPKVIASVDIAPDSGSPHRRLCAFLNDAGTKWAGKKKLSYESRVLRITVVEKLHSLLSIADPSKHTQIFFDILQTHKWLYDHPRILHRDISMNNIMFRINEHGECFGVLNDFDLASLRADLDSLTPISLRRTGTPPFMAMDLQDRYTQDIDVKHLYRHDLESLFYVILTFVVRYKVKKGDDHTKLQLDDQPALEHWFEPTQSWGALRDSKFTFFWKDPDVVRNMVKPHFKPFEDWIIGLRWLVHRGLAARCEAEDAKWELDHPKDETVKCDPALFGGGPAAPPPIFPSLALDYCEETLGDCVTYKTFGLAMLDFGEECLKVRYRYDIRV